MWICPHCESVIDDKHKQCLVCAKFPDETNKSTQYCIHCGMKYIVNYESRYCICCGYKLNE